jgi:hypothetical protein
LTPIALEIAMEKFSDPTYIVYHRLFYIFEGIVTLIEADTIFGDKSNPFKNPITQRLTLRAFSLFVEEQIKTPYMEKEDLKYENYRRFFEQLLSKIKNLDIQIEKRGEDQNFNFINSLAMLLSHCMSDFFIENFSVDPQKIRERIQSYIKELNEKDPAGIFILEVMRNFWQEALNSSTNETENRL